MPNRVAIHRTAVVATGVEIGEGTIIGPHAVILGPCRIGARCWIGPSVVIGTTGEHAEKMVVQSLPPDGELPDDDTLWFGAHGEGVVIGDRTIIRELSTVHSGTRAPTQIGSGVFMMNTCYAAHDTVVGDGARLAPHAALGGHVIVQPEANIGMAAAVHQRRVVGRGAMVGMNATVVHDVRPFELVRGNPARRAGLNRVWLERTGHPLEAIDALEAHYEGRSDVLPEPFVDALVAWDEARLPR